MNTRREFLKLLLASTPLLLAAPVATAAAAPQPLIRKLRLCGFERYQGRVLWPAMRIGDALQLRRSRDEQMPEAIAVYWGEFPIGRVAELDCRQLQSCMANGERLRAEITELCAEPRPQLTFSVWRVGL